MNKKLNRIVGDMVIMLAPGNNRARDMFVRGRRLQVDFSDCSGKKTYLVSVRSKYRLKSGETRVRLYILQN